MTLTYQDREIEVDADYVPGQRWGYDDMPVNEHVEINSVKFKGREVARLVDVDTIAELALEEIKKG